MRIAAIDIGTNSIHMVIAQTTTHGGFEVIDREREVVQIGRGSWSGRLQREAVRRTVDALARHVELARRHQVDKILCTATAAVREARNGGDFIKAAREAAGVTPRVIPSEEEGRLIYLAVKAALQLDDQPSLIVDIGGGSMQLVVGNRDKLMLATGAPLGALRLTESFIASDPPSRRDLARLRRWVRKHAREPLKRVAALEPVRVYGSSGSIHALAQVAHAMETGETIEHINGHVLGVEALAEVARQLSRLTIAERERLPGIDAQRAGIIVPGAVVLRHVLEEIGADSITLSDFGVREGLVTDYIAYHAAEISALGSIEDLRLRSVLALLAKFHADGAHPRHVAKLALSLYDELSGVHQLPASARELLHFAGLLHDIGAVIGYDGHAEHSAYIIRNGNLRGLSADEVAIIASVARYHSKARPRKRDPEFAALDKLGRRLVRWLAAILRIAESLDRSHYQLVKSLRVARRGKRVSILLAARRSARLEIWAARRRTALLEQVLGGDGDAAVRVVLDPATEGAKRQEAETARSTPARARDRDGSGGEKAGSTPARARRRGAAEAPKLKVVPGR